MHTISPKKNTIVVFENATLQTKGLPGSGTENWTKPIWDPN